MRSEHEDQVDESPLIAAIDLGSNSFHLIVARLDHGELRPVELGTVQLAAGLDQITTPAKRPWSGGSAPRTGPVLCQHAKERIRVVGTNTLRKAANSQVFVRRAERFSVIRWILSPVVRSSPYLSGGCPHPIRRQRQQLVVDIGGGSTELLSVSVSSPDAGKHAHGLRHLDPQVLQTAADRKQFDEAYCARLELIRRTGLSGTRLGLCDRLIGFVKSFTIFCPSAKTALPAKG